MVMVAMAIKVVCGSCCRDDGEGGGYDGYDGSDASSYDDDVCSDNDDKVHYLFL